MASHPSSRFGGNLGQRERVLYTTWALTFLWGALAHFDYAADDTALTVLLTAAGGVIASYTYRGSSTGPVQVGTTKTTKAEITSTQVVVPLEGDPPTQP